MPSHYAHYRFGARVLPLLPESVQQTVRKNRMLYDTGLHGPDFFFFYCPLSKNEINALGSRLHHQSGRDFFGPILHTYRLAPSEQAEAYLWGLLAHYAMDSVCHPYINDLHARKLADHGALESEYERFLLARDGKPPEYEQKMKKHLMLSLEQCKAVSRFYPGVTDRQIHTGLRSMGLLIQVLSAPAGHWRRTVEKTVDRLCPSYRSMLTPLEPTPEWEGYLQKLDELTEQAAARYPELVRQVQQAIRSGRPLGEEFQPDFG